MALVTTTEMFKKAYDGGYAIGAFNVNNMEIVQGITEAARDLEAPLILQVSKGARAYANHTYLVKLVEAAVIECPNIPIALHLDHGPDFETCKSCIDGGFTSVMIDGSHLPFEENIKLTRQVVEYAHDHGVVVEGELGRLAGVEDDVKVGDDDALYTDPNEVEEFVKATGVDSLAIAIGTSHGAFKFKGEPHLRFDILEKVSEKLPGFPIVLHGASSVMPEYVQMINQYGGNIPGAPWDGSVGVPVSSTEVSIRGDGFRDLGVCPEGADPAEYTGEICVRGPQVMRGYWKKPEETAAVMRDGWLRTGDVGHMDAKGVISITDRKKDMILVSGFNVYPNEVENVIASMPGVLEVGVVGVSSPKSGESVKAVIVKKDPALTADDVKNYCRSQLTRYKVPHQIVFVDALPKTAVGKILRRELKDL